MSLGIALFRKLLLDKAPLSVISESGLAESDFIEKELKIYEFIRGYVTRFGQLPGIETVEQETGIDIPKFPGEPIEYWIDRLIHRAKQQFIIKEGRKALSDAEEGEVSDAMSILRGILLDLDRKFQCAGVVNLIDAVGQVLESHKKRQMTVGLLGIPFGVPFIDNVSDGAQGGDTVAVVGRPGTGKTYMILHMALTAFLGRKNVLFFSPEMGIVQLGRRLVSLHTHVPVNFLKFGLVGHFAEQKIIEEIEKLKEGYANRFDIIHGSLSSTAEDLVFKARELKPDVVYVDGAYLLRPRSSFRSKWERVSETAEILKSLGIEMDIPIISTYQFNRKGAGKLENIGLSDVIGQLASIVVSLSPDPDVKGEAWDCRQHKQLELIKGRDGEYGSAKITFDLTRMNIIQTEEKRPDEER